MTNDQFYLSQESNRQAQLLVLDKASKTIPLRKELYAIIQMLISWLDMSNIYLLKSRDFTLDPEVRKLNLSIFNHYKTRSDLILQELEDLIYG